VANVLDGCRVAQRVGEEEQRASGGRFVDDTDAADRLPGEDLAADVPQPVVVVEGDLASLEELAVRLVLAVGGVATARLQAPGSVFEGAEELAELVQADGLRPAVQLLGAVVDEQFG